MDLPNSDATGYHIRDSHRVVAAAERNSSTYNGRPVLATERCLAGEHHVADERHHYWAAKLMT